MELTSHSQASPYLPLESMKWSKVLAINGTEDLEDLFLGRSGNLLALSEEDIADSGPP